MRAGAIDNLATESDVHEIPDCTRRASVVLVGRDGTARSVCAFHASHTQETK